MQGHGSAYGVWLNNSGSVRIVLQAPGPDRARPAEPVSPLQNKKKKKKKKKPKIDKATTDADHNKVPLISLGMAFHSNSDALFFEVFLCVEILTAGVCVGVCVCPFCNMHKRGL